MKIAITGTVGSGKSTVSILLRRRRKPVFDADGYASTALHQNNPCYARIIESFGTGILDEHGEIDHKKMAAIIFHEEEKRQVLNGIVHPYVKEGMDAFFAHHENDPLVFAEIPLLFQEGWQKYFDRTVVVTCSQEHAIERMMESRGYTREHALARINSQMPVEEQISLADDVLYNDGTIKDLDHQTAQWLKSLGGNGHGAQGKGRIPHRNF